MTWGFFPQKPGYRPSKALINITGLLGPNTIHVQYLSRHDLVCFAVSS